MLCNLCVIAYWFCDHLIIFIFFSFRFVHYYTYIIFMNFSFRSIWLFFPINYSVHGFLILKLKKQRDEAKKNNFWSQNNKKKKLRVFAFRFRRLEHTSEWKRKREREKKNINLIIWSDLFFHVFIISFSCWTRNTYYFLLGIDCAATHLSWVNVKKNKKLLFVRVWWL